MGTEVERKYLVKSQAWRNQVHASRYIAQGYLGGESCLVRVRLDGDEANINIKGMTPGVDRSEFEYPIPQADAELMLAQFSGELVEKRRYWARFDDHIWEIDEFLGDNRPLVVAEVELKTADEAFSVPAWADEEVTDDDRYDNVRLATHPYSRWCDD